MSSAQLFGENPSPRLWPQLSFSSTAVVHSLTDIKSEDELGQPFPETIFPTCPEGGDTLEGSMEELRKGLESGAVLIQFEVRSTQGGSPKSEPVTVARRSGGGRKQLPNYA